MLRQPLLPASKEKTVKTPIALEERQKWLELDQKPVEPAKTPPSDATHLADNNRRVEKEAAPKGDDSRDQKREDLKTPELAENLISQPRQQSQSEVVAPEKPASSNMQPDTYAAQPPVPKRKPERIDIPINLPKLSELTNLAQSTQARIDRQQKQRVKERPEIDLKDDEIWLNLQQMDNKLLSFFRRFHDKVEAVWNYPVEASSRGIEGTLLIKIIVNKKGELLDALPLESSGSDILDYEAIQAVYRAAPFGKLPNYYPHEQLKIYAHFQYSLSRRMIYGRP